MRSSAYAEKHIPGLSAHVRVRYVLTPKEFRARTHLDHHAFGVLRGDRLVRVPHRSPIQGLWFIGAHRRARWVNNVVPAAFKTARQIAETALSPHREPGKRQGWDEKRFGLSLVDSHKQLLAQRIWPYSLAMTFSSGSSRLGHAQPTVHPQGLPADRRYLLQQVVYVAGDRYILNPAYDLTLLDLECQAQGVGERPGDDITLTQTKDVFDSSPSSMPATISASGVLPPARIRWSARAQVG